MLFTCVRLRECQLVIDDDGVVGQGITHNPALRYPVSSM